MTAMLCAPQESSQLTLCTPLRTVPALDCKLKGDRGLQLGMGESVIASDAQQRLGFWFCCLLAGSLWPSLADTFSLLK